MSAQYDPVEARREWELAMIKEKLAQGQQVDTAVCHVERAVSDPSTLRFGLKRGKLLYLFRYPTHDVEREKHRNVIARARYIKNALELDGYRLIPWDFKKDRPPTFWKEDTMEEDEDDLYGPSETQPKPEEKAPVPSDDEEKGDEPMDEGLESGEEEESSDESDVEFVLDNPQTAAKPATQTPAEIGSRAIRIEQPPQQQLPSRTTSTPTTTQAGPSVPQQSGTDFPPVRTSTIDVNQDPIYPPVGKPVSQIDIDADLAENSKPWRLPGADQSDYFNYGFDEFTWEMYRQKQANMAQTLANQKAETAQFQQMFSGMGPMPGGAPSGPTGSAAGVPNAPTGPSAQQQGAPPDMGMGALPPGAMTPDQMMAYMQQLQAAGVNTDQMDFSTFMSAVAGGAPPGGQGFGGGFGGGGGAGGAGGAQFGGGGAGGGRGGGRRGGRW